MLREVYARSAMATLAVPEGEPRPTTLQPDHAPALRELMRDSFAVMCRRLGRLVTATNLDTVDAGSDPFLSLEINVPSGVEPSSLRVTMEHAVALGALASAWGRHDLAVEAEEWTERLPSVSTAEAGARIIPYR